MRRLDDIEQQYMKDDIPDFRIGDTVDVSVSIVEKVEVGRGNELFCGASGAGQPVPVIVQCVERPDGALGEHQRP